MGSAASKEDEENINSNTNTDLIAVEQDSTAPSNDDEHNISSTIAAEQDSTGSKEEEENNNSSIKSDNKDAEPRIRTPSVKGTKRNEDKKKPRQQIIVSRSLNANHEGVTTIHSKNNEHSIKKRPLSGKSSLDNNIVRTSSESESQSQSGSTQQKVEYDNEGNFIRPPTNPEVIRKGKELEKYCKKREEEREYRRQFKCPAIGGSATATAATAATAAKNNAGIVVPLSCNSDSPSRNDDNQTTMKSLVTSIIDPASTTIRKYDGSSKNKNNNSKALIGTTITTGGGGSAIAVTYAAMTKQLQPLRHKNSNGNNGNNSKASAGANEELCSDHEKENLHTKKPSSSIRVTATTGGMLSTSTSTSHLHTTTSATNHDAEHDPSQLSESADDKDVGKRTRDTDMTEKSRVSSNNLNAASPVITSTPTMETFFKSGHEGIGFSVIDYLDNDEKIQLACTCSSVNKHVINGKGIDVPIDPLISVFPSDHNHDDSRRGERFLRNMMVHHQDERKKTIFHNHHCRVKIGQVHQFGLTREFCNTVTIAELAKMPSITELDISLSTPAQVEPQFVARLMMMFPNLRKIILSNIRLSVGLLATEYCPRLETIIWKNNTKPVPGDFVWADGVEFAPFHQLKEITLDNRRFFVNFNQRDMADTTNNGKFLFQKCASNNPMLAQVSMKHAIDNFNKPVPQSVLMKFVRNVPSLIYFRSDLTPDNIAILQLERPAMVFE